MDQGLIFNIQKFSIHDGPGIRTTVFFKGCPLHCRWCANPESQSGKIEILWDAKKCSGCKKCIPGCKKEAISFQEGRIVIDRNKCDGCQECLAFCPQHALTREGESRSVADIVALCLQDKDFYEESNGGVTLSGGEALLQPAFLEKLLPALKAHDIHVALETTGFASAATFQKIAPLFDLLLFDVKHHDSIKHREMTGVTNEQILANLLWACKNGLEILPRIPVIPDFNNSLDDARSFAALFRKLNIFQVQLLPFHQFGQGKYDLLNRKYAYGNIKALYKEDLKDYQEIFIQNGIDCFF